MDWPGSDGNGLEDYRRRAERAGVRNWTTNELMATSSAACVIPLLATENRLDRRVFDVRSMSDWTTACRHGPSMTAGPVPVPGQRPQGPLPWTPILGLIAKMRRPTPISAPSPLHPRFPRLHPDPPLHGCWTALSNQGLKTREVFFFFVERASGKGQL